MIIKDLAYDLDSDWEVFKETKQNLGGHDVYISACTYSGKRNPDDPKKPNEDAYSVIKAGSSLIVGLFDGTSSLKPIASLKDQTGARFASHFLKSKLYLIKTISQL